jgi:hypothetical protein
VSDIALFIEPGSSPGNLVSVRYDNDGAELSRLVLDARAPEERLEAIAEQDRIFYEHRDGAVVLYDGDSGDAVMVAAFVDQPIIVLPGNIA